MDIVPVKVDYKIGEITSNLEEVRLAVQQAANEYKGIVITPEAVAEGKKTLAALRKEKASLDADRKNIKKAWMKPFEEWEKKAKEIIAMYDDPEKALDAQIKAYEEDRRAEKQEEIKRIHSEYSEWGDYIPLNRIYNPRWENACYSLDDIRRDIEQECFFAKAKVDAILALKSKWQDDALAVLKATGNLQAAIEKITAMNEQEERIQEERIKGEEKKTFPNTRKILCYVLETEYHAFCDFCAIADVKMEEVK